MEEKHLGHSDTWESLDSSGSMWKKTKRQRSSLAQAKNRQNTQCQWVTNQLFSCIFLPYLPPHSNMNCNIPCSQTPTPAAVSRLFRFIFSCPILSAQLSRSCEQLPRRKASWSTPSCWWGVSSLLFQLSSEAFCCCCFVVVVFSLLVLVFEDLYFLGRKWVRAVQEV